MRGIAKSEARRREREGKIGEQVQLEKLKERERSKKDMQERLKGLKCCASFSSFIIFYSLIFLVIVKRTGCSTQHASE
jgi:Eukaryotic rRNA processing protein EBP2